MLNDSIQFRASVLNFSSDPESCDPHTAPLNLVGLYIQHACNFRVLRWRMISNSKCICHTKSLVLHLNRDVLLRVKHIHVELCLTFLNSGFEVCAR